MGCVKRGNTAIPPGFKRKGLWIDRSGSLANVLRLVTWKVCWRPHRGEWERSSIVQVSCNSISAVLAESLPTDSRLRPEGYV